MPVEILIVNASRSLSDADVQAVIPALQTWDSTLVAPAWGLESCTYSFMSYGQLPDPTDPRWPIFLNRHSTDPGALGWHDDPSGKPYGRVFVGDCLRYGISWTVDLSHEAGEMRVDPTCNITVTLPDGRIALRELCDPVEDDLLAIDVGGVKMSDFVLPSYFQGGPAPWDHGGHLTGPCPTLTAGGYQSLLVNGDWQQVTAMLMGGPPSYRSMRYHHGLRLPR